MPEIRRKIRHIRLPQFVSLVPKTNPIHLTPKVKKNNDPLFCDFVLFLSLLVGLHVGSRVSVTAAGVEKILVSGVGSVDLVRNVVGEVLVEISHVATAGDGNYSESDTKVVHV